MIKFILILICVQLGHSYPEGAPNTVCTSMIPQHDVVPQQCQSKYIIQSDKTQYNTNEIIRITVRGVTNDDHFKGILLTAKNQNDQKIIGTWSVTNPSVRTVSCDDIANTAITHSSADRKLQIEALWHTPSIISNENIIIKATIVKSFDEIYVDCFNITLTPNQNDASHVQLISANTEIKSFTQTNTNLTLNYTNDVVTVTMTTGQVNVGEWRAIGFSLDQQMGDEYIFVCQVSASGEASLRRMHTKLGKRPPSNTTEDVTVIRAIYENGQASCDFSFETNSEQADGEPAPIVINKNYYITFAAGMLRVTEQVAKHNFTFVTSKTYQLQNPETLNLNEVNPTTTFPTGPTSTTTARPTTDVRVNISWTYAAGITTVKMAIKNLKISQWVAMGLSLDDMMGEDHVFICQHFANDTVSLQRYINPGSHNRPVLVDPTTTSQGGIVNVNQATYEDGITHCDFTLSNFGDIKRHERQSNFPALSQTTSYQPLIAIGNLDSSNIIMRHSRDSRTALATKVSLDRSEKLDDVAPTTPVPAFTTTAPPTTDVGVNISWTYATGITTVKMVIKNLKISQWVAMGLSLDDMMGEDHVFICQHFANDTVSLQRYINPGSHNRPVLVDPTTTSQGGIVNVNQGKYENGITYCDFTLSNFGDIKRHGRQSNFPALSQTTSYQPLIAIGNIDSSGVIMRHSQNSRTALTKRVSLDRSETIVYNAQSTDGSDSTSLMKAHGIIMIFTWIVFVSTGILIARYFKRSWSEKKICGKAVWFALHRAIMTTVAILTLIGFILILVYKRGQWVSKSDKSGFAHSIIGILVISFATIQPFIALFRCNPEDKYRFIFNYVHAFIGFSAFILSIAAMFLAMFISYFQFQVNKEWGILVAWSCWLPIIIIIFEIIEIYFRKHSSRVDKTSFDMNDRNGNGNVKIDTIKLVESVNKDRIKALFLVLHIMIAFGLALALVILIGQSKDH